MGILRILLALSVLASHLGPLVGLNLIGGSLAVQTFFIISGFYMSLILNEKYIGRNNSFKLFITNRLLRLYPLYIIVLFCSLLTCVIIGLTDHNQGFPVLNTYYAANTSFFSYLFLCLTHIFIVGQDVVMFLGINPDSGNIFFTSNFWNTSPQLYTFLFIPQAWSLSLELMFYFVAPSLLRQRLSWIVAIISCCFMLRVFMYYALRLQNDPWTYRFFPTELVFFLLGSFSYRIYKTLKKINPRPLYGYILSVVVVIYTLTYPLIPSSGQVLFQYGWKDIIYFGMIVLSIPFLFVAFKKSVFDNKIGELSYPIYISHLFIARICWVFHFEVMHTSIFIALITIVFSLILNEGVTKPLEKFRQKRLKSRHENKILVPGESPRLMILLPLTENGSEIR